MFRDAFVFVDSLEVGGFLHAGYGEGTIARLGAADLARLISAQYFGGIVCVAN